MIFACVVLAVHDGDNLRCAGIGEVRLARIDAPELAGSPRCRGRARARADCDQPRAVASREHLRALVAGRAVRCELVDADPWRAGFQPHDRYGRPVARCAAGGEDLGAAQRAGGYASAWGPPERVPGRGAP